MSSPSPPPELSTMLYRLTSLEQQLKQLQDQQIRQLQEQFKLYVPTGEHNLQLQNIQSTVSRIERDVVDMKAKQEQMEKEARTRDEQQREAQATIQIRALIGFVSFVVGIVSLVVAGYITHFFH